MTHGVASSSLACHWSSGWCILLDGLNGGHVTVFMLYAVWSVMLQSACNSSKISKHIRCTVCHKGTTMWSKASMMMFDEYCRSHLILRNLRPEGSKEYVIPKGFAFNYITCANYTFEIYGWIFFGVATQTVAAFLFIAAGSFPMSQWALGKHKRLRKVHLS